VNAIQLDCRDKDTNGIVGSTISEEGTEGDWKTTMSCPGSDDVITGFKLRIDPITILDLIPFTIIPKVAISAVEVRCSDNLSVGSPTVDIQNDPEDRWGNWEEWSNFCPIGYGVCGVQTIIQNNLGVTNLRMYCCEF